MSIKIALPKGRLLTETANLLEEAGWGLMKAALALHHRHHRGHIVQLDPQELGDFIGGFLPAGSAGRYRHIAVQHALGERAASRITAAAAIGSRQQIDHFRQPGVFLDLEFSTGERQSAAEKKSE